jgi:hypothetical protein
VQCISRVIFTRELRRQRNESALADTALDIIRMTSLTASCSKRDDVPKDGSKLVELRQYIYFLKK